MASIYDFSVKDRKNKDHELSQYENKVIKNYKNKV
jgi:glutathione peroxidase-family protein